MGNHTPVPKSASKMEHGCKQKALHKEEGDLQVLWEAQIKKS